MLESLPTDKPILEPPAPQPELVRRPPTPEPRPGGRARSTGRWLYILHLWSIFGIALSNILLGAALLTAPWTARRSRLPAASRPLLRALGLYVLLLAASMIASYDPGRSLRATGEMFNLCGPLLGLALVRGERQVRRIVDGIGVVAALIAAAGLSQYLVGFSDLHHRIRGPLSHYMTFSGVLLIGDLLLLAHLATGRGYRSLWRWAAVAVINTALVASYTRSAWVALAVTVVVLLAVRAPRLLLLLPPAALLFALAVPRPFVERMTSISDVEDVSNYDRICMAWTGFKMIGERPVFGVGPDMVKELYPIYRHPSAPRQEVPHLHNSFLQLAAERGIPALVAYFALIALSAAAALRGLRGEGGLAGPRADLYLGALLALLAFNLAGLFENNWGDTEVQRLALFLLLIPFLAAPEPDAAPVEA